MEELEKGLNKFVGKDVEIELEGFIEAMYKIEKLKYNIEHEILNIVDKEQKAYIKVNINQIYDVKQQSENIKIYLDNDINVILKIEF